MNDVIKPYFDQLIEDRNFTHATGPKPLEVVRDYIESLEESNKALEELVEGAYGHLMGPPKKKGE